MNNFFENYYPSIFPPISGMFEEFLNQLNPSIYNKPMLKKVFPYPINVYNIIDKKTNLNKETVIEIALAGFTKEEISVKAIPGKSLTIELTPCDAGTTEDEDIKFLMNGISRRRASITWTLSNKVDLTNFKPKFTNGILTIKLPIISKIEENNEIIGEITE